jgi:hypothetical protein
MAEDKCDDPVLSGQMLRFFRENCKLFRDALNIPANAERFCTTPILAQLQGDQLEIARRIFAREPVARWDGTTRLRSADITFENATGIYVGEQTLDRVLRPVFPEISSDFVSDIDKVLEFLLVDAGQDININKTQPPQFGPPNNPQKKQQQRALIMGQIVDCWVPFSIPPKYARVFRKAFGLFQDDDFDAQGGIPDMTSIYEHFWSNPDTTITHFNCLVRILGRGNVVLSDPYNNSKSIYGMGFSEEVVKYVLTFLKIATGWSEWAVDEIGKGYAYVVYTEQQAKALYERFPGLDAVFAAANRFPITLGLEDFPAFSLEQMKLFVKLLKGEKLGTIAVEIVSEQPKKLEANVSIHLPKDTDPAFPRFIKYHSMKLRGYSAKNIRNRMDKNMRQGLLSIKNYTRATTKPPSTTQEKLNVLPVYRAELVLRKGMPVFKKLNEGVSPEDVSLFVKFLGIQTPQQFVKAFHPTAMAETHRLIDRMKAENRRGIVGHVGRRTERRLRNYNNNRYSNTNRPSNNSNENYNATKGRTLTREQQARLNRDPWGSNTEGGGRRKTRRNRK